MSKSAIQWTDETWNPVTGCTKVSPGCDNCYASTLHNQRYRANVKAAIPRTPGAGIRERIDLLRATEGAAALPFPPTYDTPFAVVRCHPDRITKMLRAKRLAGRRVFVNSMSDLFHEDVPDAFLDQVFAAMALRPDVTFQVLTKRPERMREYLSSIAGLGPWERFYFPEGPLPNVWLGVSVEDQQRADERIPVLLDTPAAVRFLSCEPLLGPLDLDGHLTCSGNHVAPGACLPGIDWAIAGGESGPKARPCDLGWIRSLRDQCSAAGVPFFAKQLGRRPFTVGDRWHEDRGAMLPGLVGERQWIKLRDSHGGDWADWPEDLRVRQFPALEGVR